MINYLVATIAAALTYGILAVFFPNAFISGKFTLLTALGWVIIIMIWSFVLALMKKREEKRAQEPKNLESPSKPKKNKKKK